MDGTLEARVSGENEHNAVGLSFAHCTHHKETIAVFSDIQVGKQNVEAMGLDSRDCLCNGRGRGHREAIFFEDRRKRESDAGLVVDEEDSFLVEHEGSQRTYLAEG